MDIGYKERSAVSVPPRGTRPITHIMPLGEGRNGSPAQIPVRAKGTCSLDIIAINGIGMITSYRSTMLKIDGTAALIKGGPAIQLIFTGAQYAGFIMGSELVLLMVGEEKPHGAGVIKLLTVCASGPVALNREIATEVLMLQMLAETNGHGRHWKVEIPAGKAQETLDALAEGRYTICEKGIQVILHPAL